MQKLFRCDDLLAEDISKNTMRQYYFRLIRQKGQRVAIGFV